MTKKEEQTVTVGESLRMGQFPGSDSADSLIVIPADMCGSMGDLLSDAEIEEQLPDQWEREGDEIVRRFEFDSYLGGVGFAAGVGGLAEDAFHHPEMTIRWREVEVRLTTHDAGGITAKDITLAERLNDIAE